MTDLPETSESLLLKLRDAEDAAAWERFVAVYRPAVYRLARRRGLQNADAEDLAQQVMGSVSRAIGNWRKDSARGSFRSWLFRVARNACVNAVTRGPHDAARGGTSVEEQLQQWPAQEDAIERLIEDEHQRAVFRWAAEEVQAEFQEATWLAFRLTTIDGFSVEQAAEELGKSVGSVYASRSRVMRRLKRKVSEFQDE
jgi:RNA polymerase sigma-70 factor, ECF subfamily